MVGLNLSQVAVKCSKPDCSGTVLHRHHRRMETLFIKHFAGTAKARGRAYKKLCDNYEAFRPRDVVVICKEHHAEIHRNYARIIGRHLLRRRKPMSRWTWAEARELMRDLNRYCRKWERRRTPGIEWNARIVVGGKRFSR